MEILLSNGAVAVVDDADAALVGAHKWTAQRSRGTTYAYRRDYSGDKPRKVYLHRLIVGALSGELTDHIDGDGLNNRRANLRKCSNQQNMRNKQRGCGSSAHKGVSWFKRDQCWRAYITQDATQVHLGYFASEVEAAQAYDVAAKLRFGAFAKTNLAL